MTFTGRIRTYLVLVALLPPVLVMGVLYLQSARQTDSSARRQATLSLTRFARFEHANLKELRGTIEEIGVSSQLRQSVTRIGSGRTRQADLSLVGSALDFLEIVDSTGAVIASRHRPGLVGSSIDRTLLHSASDSGFIRTIEYDIEGSHGAYALVVPLRPKSFLYAGRYLSGDYLVMIKEMIGAEIELRPTDSAGGWLKQMDLGRLYSRGDTLVSVISGGDAEAFYLVARFIDQEPEPLLESVVRITGLVALVSILVAVGLGFLVTSRAKREIDNLTVATSRVAEGDFSTPVMALEEGEFSQLADSFSEMMVKLKALQAKLGTTEKIAAWQAMGRKIAHEVRNPLTPIMISVDDLRRSWTEQQPDFERILMNTSGTVKTEITRLNEMLDQFVNFARMKPPVPVSVSPAELLDRLKDLYSVDSASGQLAVSNLSTKSSIHIDLELIQQLLINLVKNSFEVGEKVTVRVTLADAGDNLIISVEDNGTGFPDEILQAGFQPQLSRKVGGSGLGLVVCQRIVFDHSGTIELYNRDEGGAGVVVIIPVANTPSLG